MTSPDLSDCELAFDDGPFDPARMTVEMYHRMIGTDVFAEDERFELLEGIIVARGPKSPPHVYSSTKLDRCVTAILTDAWHAMRYAPLTLADSEPEPDFTVIRGALEDYRDHHPNGESTGLVAEVADVTLVKDRRKARIYGRAGIPFYWLVNLNARLIECFSEPFISDRRAGYKCLRLFTEDDQIPLILEESEVGRVAVRDILPPVCDEVSFNKR